MFQRPSFFSHARHDRLFLGLLGLNCALFIGALFSRHTAIERTPIPFNLGLLFFIVNLIFAGLALPRDPFLAYMFLTATILSNTTLIFFFHYLVAVQ